MKQVFLGEIMKKKFIAGIIFAASLTLGAGVCRQSVRADEQNGYNADIPQMEGQSIEDEAADLYRSSLPQKYVTNNLPKIKNQSPYGACWAFAMAALAEINAPCKLYIRWDDRPSWGICR